MKNTKNKQCLIWATILVVATFLISLLTGKENGFTMIRGEPLADYEITLNAANTPTTSSEYISTNQVVRYTNFEYYDAIASNGNHVEIGPWGYISNALDSPITSITGVTATFTTDGVVKVFTSYDNYNWFDYVLTSGVRLELPFLPYYISFDTEGTGSATYSNISITYSCSPHETSLDKYRVYWYDEDNTLLEVDYDVEPGTMPSYDGPTPTKAPEEDVYYTFNGWDYELAPVFENSFYTATYTEVTLTFNLIAFGSAYELTGVSDSSIQGISIPATYDGIPVTSIGVGVFSNFVNLTYVEIPIYVNTINDDAFAGCSSLTTISLPQNVDTISPFAFAGCFSLTAYNVDAANLTFASVDGVVFSNDLSEIIAYPSNHGTSYTIPSGTVIIREFAFLGSKLTSVVIPSSVTTIQGNAFVASSLLNNVVIPDTVTSLGTGVFVNCTSLSNVTLPSGLTSLPASLFYGCTSLADVTLPSTITTIGNQAFSGCTSLTAIELPAGLSSIGGTAFNGCVLLGNVTLPNGLLTIGANAFTGCNAMTIATIPASVTTIFTYAFSDCSSLTAINVEAANTAYASADGILFNHDFTTLIAYPKGKTTVEYFIPSTVSTLSINAFRNNPYLTKVYIPETVTTIESHGFYGCPNLSIYSATSGALPGWSSTWNPSNAPVMWNSVFQSNNNPSLSYVFLIHTKKL